MNIISSIQAKILPKILQTICLVTTHNPVSNFSKPISHINQRIILISRNNPLPNPHSPNTNPRLTNNLNTNPSLNTITLSHSLRLQIKLQYFSNSSQRGKRRTTILQFKTRRNIWCRLKKRLSVSMLMRPLMS